MNVTLPKWTGHSGFGVHAFDSLPQWEQSLVQPDMSPQALDKSYLPKGQIQTPGEKMGFLCVIMDLIYYEQMRPYGLLPDGRWIPHGPPDANWQSTPGTGQVYSHVAYTDILELLLNRTLAPLRGGDWEEMIRHAGALGHFVQEPFTPGHALDNKLFHELFPDPDPQRHMRLHHAFDAGTNDFEPLPPKLMGTTVPEAAYRLLIEIERGMHSGKRLIPAVIGAAYAGQPRSVREALLCDQAQRAAWLTACAWHTLFCIAYDRFDDDEVALLRCVDLTEVLPYFWHAWQYVELLPGCLVQQQRKIPIHVWGPDGKEQHVAHGFGMGGHMGIKFYVNGELYPRFRCRVGLPSRHTEGQNEHTHTTFFVEIDRQFNTTYSEEIDYGAHREAEITLVPGAPVQSVDVNLHGARSLILGARSQPYTDPATGRPTYVVPHVAVCEPRLERA